MMSRPAFCVESNSLTAGIQGQAAMLLNRVKVKKSYAKHRHDSDVKHFVVQCRSVWCYGKPVIGLGSFLVFCCDTWSNKFSQLC